MKGEETAAAAQQGLGRESGPNRDPSQGHPPCESVTDTRAVTPVNIADMLVMVDSEVRVLPYPSPDQHPKCASNGGV